MRTRLYLLLVAAAAGCEGPCIAGVGLMRVVPGERTIAAGQSYTVKYQEGGGCPTEDGDIIGEHYRDVRVTWSSSDPAVARVDSLTGRVIGLRRGDAELIADNYRGVGIVHVR